MQVQAVEPAADANMLLSGAQFADAFSVVIEGTALDARQAAERMMSRSPRWATMLLAVRDILVAPFGLTTSKTAQQAPVDKVGMFPVISQTPQRLVAGFDDSHLDFRVMVDVTAAGRGQRVTATTIVLTHNLLGRVYLTVILPFHHLIVRAMVRQVAS